MISTSVKRSLRKFLHEWTGLVAPPLKPVSLREVKEKAWQSGEAAQRYRENVGRVSIGMQRELETALRFTYGRVLDVGAGTGRFSTWLANYQREVYALDISAQMLREVNTSAASPIQFTRASAFKLPFADKTFDSVISFWLLVHFREWTDILSEMIRVVKPGGLVTFEINNRFNFEKGAKISPGAAFVTRVNNPGEFTAFADLEDVKAAAARSGANIVWSHYYDIFNDNFVAQAIEADKYPDWLTAINDGLADEQCRSFWYDFEEKVLPSLPQWFARKQLIVLQKTGSSSKSALPVAPLTDGLNKQLQPNENAVLYKLFLSTFSRCCPELQDIIRQQ